MRLYFSNFISSLYKNIEKMNGWLDELLFGLKKKIGSKRRGKLFRGCNFSGVALRPFFIKKRVMLQVAT